MVLLHRATIMSTIRQTHGLSLKERNTGPRELTKFSGMEPVGTFHYVHKNISHVHRVEDHSSAFCFTRIHY